MLKTQKEGDTVIWWTTRKAVSQGLEGILGRNMSIEVNSLRGLSR